MLENNLYLSIETQIICYEKILRKLIRVSFPNENN